MLLAGNGSSPTQNKPVPMAQVQPVQATVLRPGTPDGFIRSWSHITSPCSGVPSLPSVFSGTSHSGSHCGGRSNSNHELAVVKPVGVAASPSGHSEPAKVVSSVGPATTTQVSSGITSSMLLNLQLFGCNKCDMMSLISQIMDLGKHMIEIGLTNT